MSSLQRLSIGARRRIALGAARGYVTAGLWRPVPLGTTTEAVCRARRDAIALVDGDTAVDFDALHDAVRRLSSSLASLGVGQGDAVAYQLPNWWEAAVVLLATVRLGAHAVPVVPFLSTREVTQILAQTRPRVVVIPERLGATEYPSLWARAVGSQGPGFPRPRLVLVRPDRTPDPAVAWDFGRLLGGDAETPPSGLAPPTGPPPSPVDPDPEAATFGLDPHTEAATFGVDPDPEAATFSVDPQSVAVVIYTSGSTAAPKGAMHTHQTLDAELSSLRVVHDLGVHDRVLMPSPLTHVSGVIHGILAPALLGTSAVLMDRWNAGTALRLIEEHRVTYMIGAPTFLQEMLAHADLGRRDLSSLRLFSCGGASVSPELMRQGRERLPGLVTKRVYGSSEFPTISTTSAEDAATRGLDTEGRPLPGVELRICDEAGTECPAGIEGEIRARGPDCFVGYVDESLDDETFDHDGFLRTGDLGVVDAAGYLTVTGRVKDIIVRKGEKISAREIEDLILQHPAIAEAAVVALADPDAGEIACACVRPVAGEQAPTLEELVAFLRGLDLTSRKLPERLVTREDFPRAPSGKIHKKRLREEVERLLAPGGPGR